MPQRMKRPCAHPGCPNLVEPPARYCHVHADEERAYDKRRGTATQRGYNSFWRRVRLAYLHEHPLCEMCLEKGIIKPAQDVHHRDGDVTNLAPENLQALCRACHNKITMKQHRKYG